MKTGTFIVSVQESSRLLMRALVSCRVPCAGCHPIGTSFLPFAIRFGRFPHLPISPPGGCIQFQLPPTFHCFFFSRRPLDTLRHTHALAHTLPTIPPTLATFYEPTFLTSLRPSQNYGSVLHCGTSAALIIRWLVTCIDPGVVLFLFLAPLPFYLLFVSSSPSSFFFSPR